MPVGLEQKNARRHLTVVDDANEALARLPSAPSMAPDYDVVLDYHLPGFNALEAAKILRQDRGLSLPIVLVTSEGNEEIVTQALRLGIADYLVKHPNYLL